MCVCIYVTCMQVPRKARGKHQRPWTEVKGTCNPPFCCWELKSSPLQKQYILLSIQTCFQSFEMHSKCSIHTCDALFTSLFLEKEINSFHYSCYLLQQIHNHVNPININHINPFSYIINDIHVFLCSHTHTYTHTHTHICIYVCVCI